MWKLPLLYRIGTWSVARRVLAFIPTSRGLPRRVATHSPGKCLLLKHKANAPSYSGLKMKEKCSKTSI